MSRTRPIVRAGPVHLVDEGDTRHTIFIRLTPHGFRLRFHTTDRTENGDSAVQHSQRPLDLCREIHVAGSIDDIDADDFSRSRSSPRT